MKIIARAKEFFQELQPMPALPKQHEREPDLQVSLIIPARNSDPSLATTLKEAHAFLSQHFPDSFEIIVVPNSSSYTQGYTKGYSKGDSNTQTRNHSDFQFSQFSQLSDTIKIYPHTTPRGKGAAVRTGFQKARGRWIFLTDADLPYDLTFFNQAAEYLEAGYDLVTGNRRLVTSHFQIPVGLLPIAYSRHRLGLLFNRMVRWVLPIRTTDTQAGIKALSRRLADEAFSRQKCPGFLFDLEIFLTATAFNFRQTDLPVTLHLNSEKSTVRILRECILVLNWLTQIAWNYSKKTYGANHLKKTSQKILSRYKEAPWLSRFFLRIRWHLTPYNRMVSYLPWKGIILDLGCGHGLLSLAAAMESPSRTVLGVDHDLARVKLGKVAIEDLPNLSLQTGNLVQPPLSTAPYSGITLIDVLHYFDSTTQETILKNSYNLLANGGTLLVREVDFNRGLLSQWNRFYEAIATKIGFTQAEKKELHFRTRYGWETFIKQTGFQVRSERCSSFLFEDILYVCKRPQLDTQPSLKKEF